MPARGGSPSARARPTRPPTDAFDDFLDLWARLRADSARPGTVVLVEGERDTRSLRRLDLPGTIVEVHQGRTVSATAQALASTSRLVIVMTDWDTAGGHLAQRLKGFLGAERLRLDLDYRRRFARILRGELVHVEGLHGWARRQAEKRGNVLELLLDGDAGGPLTE